MNRAEEFLAMTPVERATLSRDERELLISQFTPEQYARLLGVIVSSADWSQVLGRDQ